MGDPTPHAEGVPVVDLTALVGDLDGDALTLSATATVLRDLARDHREKADALETLADGLVSARDHTRALRDTLAGRP